MKIAIIISSLRGGGAERIATILGSYWVNRGSEVTFLLFSPQGDNAAYDVDEKANIVHLGRSGVSRSPIRGALAFARRIITLRQALQELSPDLVISFLDRTNITTILASRGLNIPTIITEHNVPSHNQLSKPWELLRSLTYPRATALVVLTEATRAYYKKRLGLESFVIPNPVLPPPVMTYSPDTPTGKEESSPKPINVIAIGRLHEVKGFDMLLAAMHRVVKECPNVHLTIWGEGPELEHLNKLLRDLKLEPFVSMPGRTADIYSKLRAADLLVLSSRHEAFPNAMLEGLAVGLPIVAFDCPSGPSAIIDHGQEGLLVPAGQPDAMAAALVDLINNPDRRSTMSKASLKRAKDFELDRVMKQWQICINQITGLQLSELRSQIKSGHHATGTQANSTQSCSLNLPK